MYYYRYYPVFFLTIKKHFSSYQPDAYSRPEGPFTSSGGFSAAFLHYSSATSHLDWEVVCFRRGGLCSVLLFINMSVDTYIFFIFLNKVPAC